MEKNRETILRLINSKANNDLFRKDSSSDSDMYAYDTQIETAKEIVVNLACNEKRSNHVTLVAPMQGGKTGTINSVVNIIEATKLNRLMNVSKYFFITGMNDCGLKAQTYERVIGQIINANEDNTYKTKGDKKRNSYNRYYVLKNSDLLGYDGVLDNSVIFIDEAHYGSNATHILTQFLEKHKVDWKNADLLMSRSIYIVSVSATLFDELVSDTLQNKNMVVLETDEDYVDVTTYIENDCVHQADKYDIMADGAIFDYIDDAYERMSTEKEKGIIFVRTTKYNTIKDGNKISDRFEIFEMDSSKQKIQYELLSEKIDLLINDNLSKRKDKGIKPLLVLIKGAFRAGITIKAKYKDIVYMIYDYSLKADATAQALLGRMCGYRHGCKDIAKCHFYINLKLAEQYSNWEQNFQNRKLIPSDKEEFVWVDDNCQDPNLALGSKSCGNFYIPLSDTDILKFHRLSKLRGKNKEMDVAALFDAILRKYGKYPLDYQYLMEAYLKGKNNYAASSRKLRFDNFSEDSNAFVFRPNKIKKFMDETGRTELEMGDVGKKAVVLVLDTNVYPNNAISGNRRLLVYHFCVSKKKLVLSRKKQYKPHKDTALA